MFAKLSLLNHIDTQCLDYVNGTIIILVKFPCTISSHKELDYMSWKELHLSQNNHLLSKVRQSIVWFQMSFQYSLGN